MRHRPPQGRTPISLAHFEETRSGFRSSALFLLERAYEAQVALLFGGGYAILPSLPDSVGDASETLACIVDIGCNRQGK